MAKDSIYTRQLAETICRDIAESGMSLRSAGALCGIPPQTIKSWMARGRAWLDSDGAEGHEWCAEFVMLYEKARADFEHAQLLKIQTASDRDSEIAAKQAQWLLSRASHTREDWAERSKVELTGKDGAPLPGPLAALPDGELDRRIAVEKAKAALAGKPELLAAVLEALEPASGG